MWWRSRMAQTESEIESAELRTSCGGGALFGFERTSGARGGFNRGAVSRGDDEIKR